MDGKKGKVSRKQLIEKITKGVVAVEIAPLKKSVEDLTLALKGFLEGKDKENTKDKPEEKGQPKEKTPEKSKKKSSKIDTLFELVKGLAETVKSGVSTKSEKIDKKGKKKSQDSDRDEEESVEGEAPKAKFSHDLSDKAAVAFMKYALANESVYDKLADSEKESVKHLYFTLQQKHSAKKA